MTFVSKSNSEMQDKVAAVTEEPQRAIRDHCLVEL